MARPSGLSDSQTTIVREISGEIAADDTTLSDANYPATDALDCYGFDTMIVGVEIDDGTNPTCTLELLFRDEDADDESRWRRLLVGAAPGQTAAGSLSSHKTPALESGQFVEVQVWGRKVYLRRDAVTNATGTTAMRVLAFPGRRR